MWPRTVCIASPEETRYRSPDIVKTRETATRLIPFWLMQNFEKMWACTQAFQCPTPLSNSSLMVVTSFFRCSYWFLWSSLPFSDPVFVIGSRLWIPSQLAGQPTQLDYQRSHALDWLQLSFLPCAIPAGANAYTPSQNKEWRSATKFTPNCNFCLWLQPLAPPDHTHQSLTFASSMDSFPTAWTINESDYCLSSSILFIKMIYFSSVTTSALLQQQLMLRHKRWKIARFNRLHEPLQPVASMMAY